MAHQSRGSRAAISLALGAAIFSLQHVAAAAAPTWLVQQRVTVPDESSGFFSADLAGSTLIIGDGSAGEEQGGEAHLFEREGTSWSLKQTVAADDLAFNNNFGGTVTLDGDTAVVTATQQTPGALYIYARSAGTWSLQQKLVNPEPPAQYGTFGWCPRVSGNSLVAGGNDAIYVYVRSGSTWSLQKKLAPADGAALQCAYIDGDTVVAGAPNRSDSPKVKQGAAYVFVRSGSVWSEQQKLLTNDSVNFDAFGNEVVVQGDTVLASTWPNVGRPGKSYVFTRSGTTWTQGQTLTSSDGSAVDGFGSLAFKGNTALIGATLGHNQQGAAYFFTRNGSTWTETLRLDNPPPADSGRFGGWTALSGDYAMATNADSVWIFKYGKVAGDACAVTADCGGSGVCSAEGVCCDALCDSGCDSCLASRKATGADGVCGPVKVDTDPLEACAAESASTCGTTGVCDGAGACSIFAVATECAPTSCPTPTSQDANDQCNGDGACVATDVVDCGVGYACVAGACKTSCEADLDCDGANAFVCGSGTCKVPSAQPCNVASDCDSGYCVDGLCCDKACDGQCEACAEPKHEGICVAVAGEPRGEREACDAVGDPACAARCDGAKRDTCQYVPATTSCGCASSDAQQLCDGQGFCAIDSPRACGGFACRDAGCLSACASDQDCGAGFGCAGGHCNLLSTATQCSEDLSKTVSAEGSVVDCSPYQCDPSAGVCRATCSASDECGSGFECSLATRSCVAEASEGEDAGCSCRSVGGPGSQRAGVLLLALLTACGLRRRGRTARGARA